MLNKMKPFLCATLLACALPLVPAGWNTAALASPMATQASDQAVISGTVTDAQSGVPLKGVYVRQKDALNATFTDAQGHFHLSLMPEFSNVVLFEVEGYETISLPFQQSQDKLQINLQPLTHFSTPLPQAHEAPEMSSEPIFGSQFTAFYQLNYSLFNQNGVGINGLVLNEFGVATDLKPFQNDLTFRGRFFRSRMPINIDNFPFQPAFYVNRLQAKIGGGKTSSLGDKLEFYWGPDVILDYRSPDNRNSQDQQPVPFTGSLLDYEQTYLGLGASAALGWKLSDRLTLFPELSLYPVSFDFVNRDSNKVQYALAGDLGAKLRFEIVPGAYVVGQYDTQLWYSFGDNGFENNHFFQLGISLDPWTLAERLK